MLHVLSGASGPSQMHVWIWVRPGWAISQCSDWCKDGSFNHRICISLILNMSLQMDWVCDDAWIGPFTQAMFFLGAAIGAIVFGYISDVYGRYPTFVATNVVRIICSLVQVKQTVRDGHISGLWVMLMWFFPNGLMEPIQRWAKRWTCFARQHPGRAKQKFLAT